MTRLGLKVSGILLSLTVLVACRPTVSLPSPEQSVPPTARNAPTPKCTEDGLVQSARFESPTLGWAMHFQYYLPPCYEEQAEKSYPVLYLIPGRGGGASSWNAAGAAETANRLIRDGQVPPFILVTPANYSSDTHGTALMADLMPYVDEHFRTLTSAEDRAVGGASLGGTIAFRMAFESAGLFGHVGVFGSGVGRGDEANMDAWIGAMPVAQWPRVLIDSGDRDPELVSAERMAEIMDRWHIPYTLNVEPGEHSFAYWASNLEMYLRWFTAEW